MNLDVQPILLSILSSTIIAGLSIFLFYCFKRSYENSPYVFRTNHHQLPTIKKKSKKKVNAAKFTKNKESVAVAAEEESENTTGCSSIKEELNCDIIIESQLVTPVKSILKKPVGETAVKDEKNCGGTLKNMIFEEIEDIEIEAVKSRHSSAVSDLENVDLKGGEVHCDVKLTRCQKKRQRAKIQKVTEGKENGNINNIQANDSDINNDSEIFIDDEDVKSTNNLENNNKSSMPEKKITNKNFKSQSFISSDSYEVNKQIQSFSTAENIEKLYPDSFAGDLQSDLYDENVIDENTNKYNVNTNFNIDHSIMDNKMKLEHEIKELKDEKYNLLQKLNELSSITSTVNTLKKENEMYSKKYDNLERTFNAMKKELTSIVQKNSATEGLFARFKAEKNQHFAFYDNELGKQTNKVKLLENDIRTKVMEHETLKISIDKLHHLVSEKDKHIQNQNIEISSLKEQLYKKRIDCQELESQIKTLSYKLNDAENKNQLSIEESEKYNAQIEMLKKDKHNIKKEFEDFSRQTKAQDREQSALISSLQYQLDEFRKEKQQSLLFNRGNDDEKVPNQKRNIGMSSSYDSCNVPEGFELIESSLISKFTTLIKEGNQKLQEKSNNYNTIVNEYKNNEKILREQNSILNDKYSKLNTDFEGHLNEIVNLRQCIDTLRRELSKNSHVCFEDVKRELNDKNDALLKTEEILVKLECSVDDEKNKWQDSLKEGIEENLKLENEVKSQGALINNQNKKISDLTAIIQSYNNLQNDLLFNGALPVDLSETSNQ